MASCKKECGEIFKISNFNLEHDNPELFVTSQWLRRFPCWRTFYVVYRTVLAVFWLVVLILSGVKRLDWYDPEVDGTIWFIYLTNWGLLILALDVLVQAINTIYAYVKWKKRQNADTALRMSWYLKTQWVLFNISLCVGFFITIAAGIMFYSVDLKLQFTDVASHLINSIYLFFNLFVTAVPIRVYHVFHVMVFSTVYIIFSVILKHAADILAYSAIDWSNPKIAVMAAFLGGLLSAILLWLLIYALYRLRLAVCDSLMEKRGSLMPT